MKDATVTANRPNRLGLGASTAPDTGGPASDAPEHSVHSSTREKLIEHLFVGELLRCLWQSGYRDMEVLRPEVDSAGYDLAIECNGILRHIQLKASHRAAKTREVSINTRLAAKPAGCVIWVHFDAETLEVGPFLWFGGERGMPLPDLGGRMGRHTRANRNGKKESRPGIRVLGKGAFETLDTIDEVSRRLFQRSTELSC